MKLVEVFGDEKVINFWVDVRVVLDTDNKQSI